MRERSSFSGWSPEKTEELIQRYYPITSMDMQVIYFVAHFLRMLLHPNNDKRQKGRPKLDDVCKLVLKKYYYKKVAKQNTKNTWLVKQFTLEDIRCIKESISNNNSLDMERKEELIGKIERFKRDT